MAIEKELNALFETLKEQRDEIELQLHLAGMEAKEQWHKAEPKWQHFIDELGIVNDDTKEVSADLMHAAKVIGDDLKETYQRIIEKLEK